MGSNLDQPMSGLSQAYPDSRQGPQTVSPNLRDYMITDARHPRVDAISNHSQTSPFPSGSGAEPVSPFSSEYNLAFHSSPQDTVHGLGLDGTFDSPTDLKSSGIYTHQPAGSIDNVTSMPGAMVMPTDHRNSIASIGTQQYGNHNGSIDGSDVQSPSSSRGQGQRTSDEILPATYSLQQDGSADGKENEEDEKATKPAWSELKTKAGKERKRLPLACIACRRKKIRCSGEKPACKHCLRSRIPCVYKVTTRKAAPRTDYMAMLDKRLKRMEERVIKVIPKEDLRNISAIGRAVVKPALPSAPKQKKRSADEAFVVELHDWTQSRNKSTIDDAVARSKQQKGEETNLLTEGAEYLPSIELQEHLSEVFFDCIYGQSYLLLHKPSFIRKLKAGSVPPVLILAVCAISARFSTHPQVSTEPAFLRGKQWAAPARAIVEARHHEPNITILTVLLILGLHYFGTCEGGLSWSFGKQAGSMAYALQLHRELDQSLPGRKQAKPSDMSFTDQEIRRRTMWACFLMDKFNSSGTERPPMVNEEYLRIQLPIRESYFQMEIPGPTEDLDGGVPNPASPGTGQVSDPKGNMGVAAHVIRAIALWGETVKYLNLGGKEKDPYHIWQPESKFKELRHKVDEFKNTFPAMLVWTNQNLQTHASHRVANQFLFLHIITQQNVLFLNRFAIPGSPGVRPPKDMPKSFLSEAGRIAVDAADQISMLIEQAAGYLLTAPFAGYCAYAASTVHVWGIFSKNPQLEATSKENLRHNYKYLNKMKKYWGMFHSLADNIKEIYRLFADAALKGSVTGSSSNVGSPMYQYGDWFDKYPHGVSRTDWEDPEAETKKETGNDAVMSQQSDLQSVEEFFASLSPPSKAESSRKTARRHHGKSASEHMHLLKSTTPNSGPTNADVKFDPNSVGQTLMGIPVSSTNTTTHVRADSQSSMPLPDFTNQQLLANANTNPALYNQAQTPTFTQNNPYDFSSFYPNQLSQLDRQLVFGAYADLDPTSSLGNVGPNGGLNVNLWDGLDMNGLGQGFFNEPTSAWFMPFDMGPPDVGLGDYDGMTWGGVDSAGNSFSAQGGQGGGPRTGGTGGGDELEGMDMSGIGAGQGKGAG